jgi:hypothetical protein
MFYDLEFFHGSDEVITSKPTSPFYATTNLRYKHTQKENLHKFKLNVKCPYFTDNISLIEAIGKTPERIKLLSTLGYDCVAYCKPGNPLAGASGWGDDAAQFLIIEPSIVEDWQLSPPLPNNYQQPFTPTTPTKKMYHSAARYFTRFQETQDIGFHFGSKSAALNRQKALNSIADVEVKTMSPSSVDLLTLTYDKAEFTSEKEALIALLLRKLDLKNADKMLETVNKMPLPDIQETYSEYKDKPDRSNYEESLQSAIRGEHYVVLVDGNIRSEHDDKAEALAYAKAFKQGYLKSAVLLIESPLEMEDLGTWPFADILKEITDDSSTLNYFYALDETEQKDFVIEMLENAGYDGIKYNNVVEGGVSYIAFYPEQIHTYNERLPELPETPKNDLASDFVRPSNDELMTPQRRR